MEPIDLAEAARLSVSLSIAGGALLIMEVFFSNRVFAIFGVISLVIAGYMTYHAHGLVVTLLYLQGAITVVSLGFLLVLTYLPNSPLARDFLKRSRQRQEDAEETGEQDER